MDTLRSIYDERWGHVDMRGWTVRIKTTTQRDRDAGLTLQEAKTLDIAVDSLVYLPHELRHVQLGPSSYGPIGQEGSVAEFSPNGALSDEPEPGRPGERGC